MLLTRDVPDTGSPAIRRRRWQIGNGYVHPPRRTDPLLVPSGLGDASSVEREQRPFAGSRGDMVRRAEGAPQRTVPLDNPDERLGERGMVYQSADARDLDAVGGKGPAVLRMPLRHGQVTRLIERDGPRMTPVAGLTVAVSHDAFGVRMSVTHSQA